MKSNVKRIKWLRLSVNGGMAGKLTCARRLNSVAKRYELNSCLRSISLGYGPKRHINIAAAAPIGEALL